MKILSMKVVVSLLCGLGFISSVSAFEIDPRGFWGSDASEGHYTDWPLAWALVDFFEDEGAKTIIDCGCGEGDYVRTLIEAGFDAEGYDGNPYTPILTKGVGKVQDLSVPVDFGKTVDWVMSLEVGEHLPKQFETIFIENLMRHAEKGILLSWALEGQGGAGHFNEQNNDYIKAIFARYGYTNDVEAENKLRKIAAAGWFKRTIMVFRK